MGRPHKHSVVDLSQPHELTAGLIERLHCPADKSQAFLRDRKAPTLRVRVTLSGAKAFVFEAKLGRQTIRRTIGDVRSWTIEAARAEANRQRVLVDKGADPRELERQAAEARRVTAVREASHARTVGEVWDRVCPGSSTAMGRPSLPGPSREGQGGRGPCSTRNAWPRQNGCRTAPSPYVNAPCRSHSNRVERVG